MSISRRTILKGATILPVVANSFGFRAAAQTSSADPGTTEAPPVLFVHGNGDHAAVWITTMWRMESNGVPRDRMFAINFTDPLARTDDSVPQPNRSSTEDARRELGEAIKELKRRTGASRVALVGNSRGGNPDRNYAGSAGQPPRPRDGNAGRRSNQSSGRGCVGRDLSRIARHRRAHRRRDPCLAIRREWTLGAG